MHGLDVDDVYLDPPGKTPPHIKLKHRLESRTTLQNGINGERSVGLPKLVAEVVKAWIENPDRPDVKDDYGRHPLFATQHGRRHRNGIREIVYGVTRPCTYLGECPISNRDIETCKAASDRTNAYDCPETVSPHAIRKGVATRQLNKEEEMERRFDEFNEEYE